MTEFKINEYLTLRFDEEYGRTDILVKGRSVQRWGSSIVKSWRASYADMKVLKDEFNNRRSTMQEWLDNDYDMTVIPFHIGFPVLKKLFSIKEPVATKVFERRYLDGLFGEDSKIFDRLFSMDYLILFKTEFLDSIFKLENYAKFSGGKIRPSNLYLVKLSNFQLYKLILKSDLDFYIQNDRDDRIENLLVHSKRTIDDLTEDDLKECNYKKLNNIVNVLLRTNLDYFIENYYSLDDFYEMFKNLCKFLIFRNEKSFSEFFKTDFSQLNEDQKIALMSFLLTTDNDIKEFNVKENLEFLKDLDWGNIIRIIMGYFEHAYGRSKIFLNKTTLQSLVKNEIPF